MIMSRQRDTYFDFLRGKAIIMVIATKIVFMFLFCFLNDTNKVDESAFIGIDEDIRRFVTKVGNFSRKIVEFSLGFCARVLA